MVTGNRDFMINQVVQWYQLRAGSKPYYRICFGEVSSEKARTFSTRGWGDASEKIPVDQLSGWLRADLQMMPTGSYVIQVRKSTSDNRSGEEFPFFLPAGENSPQPSSVNSPPPGFLSAEEVERRITERMAAFAAEQEMKKMKEQLGDLQKENRELKKNSDFGSISREFIGLVKPIVNHFTNNGSAVSGTEKKNDSVANQQGQTVDVEATVITEEKMEELDDQLSAELERLANHLGGPVQLVEALHKLNDKLDQPGMKDMILSFL